jgi:hypothetical protein
MLGYCPRQKPILRPVRMRGFEDERLTKIGLYDIADSMTLESNKIATR